MYYELYCKCTASVAYCSWLFSWDQSMQFNISITAYNDKTLEKQSIKYTTGNARTWKKSFTCIYVCSYLIENGCEDDWWLHCVSGCCVYIEWDVTNKCCISIFYIPLIQLFSIYLSLYIFVQVRLWDSMH